MFLVPTPAHPEQLQRSEYLVEGDDIASTLVSDAVLILTEWQQYRQLDWQALAPLLRQPAWIFDARSVVDPAAVAAAGLQLWQVDGGDLIKG